MIVSMTPRTLSRTVSSIGSNQSSKSMVPAAIAAVFVVFFVMAWSPFRRSNAGISWGEHPGDYANRISTTSATGPLGGCHTCGAVCLHGSGQSALDCAELRPVLPPDREPQWQVLECEWRRAGRGRLSHSVALSGSGQ